jgi:hypothetical protein
MAPLPPQGFIAHYITGVLYPASWADAVPVVLFALVAASWAVYVWRGRHRGERSVGANRPISSNGEL